MSFGVCTSDVVSSKLSMMIQKKNTFIQIYTSVMMGTMYGKPLIFLNLVKYR